MFTGIIESIGTIMEMVEQGGDVRLSVDAGTLDLSDVKLGDSIATNGVCLTVVSLTGYGFSADVSRETLSLSTLHRLRPGSKVNLERALTLNSRLGGHLVSGHVDGVGRVVDRKEDARSIRFQIQAPDSLAKYIAHKGSICVDGASLTVNAIQGSSFQLNIVPHTLQETIMDEYRPGSEVNLEVDLIARYLERLMLGEEAASDSESGVTEALLKSRGFLP
ncbi:MAG: riboflavin synthase [Candidatus Thiodiazotropha sp. (ex Monitilora ramsayi)]|nr:riboflavin synthase [Candidatus Thiodiazotropha sp. (ex Monitilora ramsayi)]